MGLGATMDTPDGQPVVDLDVKNTRWLAGFIGDVRMALLEVGLQLLQALPRWSHLPLTGLVQQLAPALAAYENTPVVLG